MEQDSSAKELEVARILLALPWLVWEADHPPPCTLPLRWGARRKRSAGDDESPTPAPAPPLPHPAGPSPAAEKLSRKRARERTKPCPAADILKVKPSVEAVAVAAAAKDAPGSYAPGKLSPSPPRPPLSRRAGRRGANPGDHQEHPPAAAVPMPTEETGAAPAPEPETSSPETPLDFWPSSEERDAQAKPATVLPPPAKKPRPKHEELSKQVDQLNLTRAELHKEAAESRNWLDYLRGRNSKLMELRNKLAEEADRQGPQEADRHLHRRSCLDLLPMFAVRSIPAATVTERAHTGPQQQQYQRAWPLHWVSNRVAAHQSPAAGNQQWSLDFPRTWRLDGDKGSSCGTLVPDLSTTAEKDLGVESQPERQQGYHYYHHQQQQQQLPVQEQQRKSSPEEQKAARKKRIEMIQKRRGGASGVASRISSLR